MKRTLPIGFVLIASLLVWLVPHLFDPALGHAAGTEAPHIGEGGLPQFEKDPNFPKVPSKWRMVFAPAVAIDAQNHVWILSRPRGLRYPRSTPPDYISTPAPPVMEFDNDGNFIQGWGGISGP